MRRALALSIATVLLAAACGGSAVTPTASPTAAASAAAATATPKPSPFKLVVSYSNIIGDELPLWSTKEGGLFEQNALEIGDLQNISSAQGVPAVISNNVQVAQVGGSEVLSVNAEGGDLVVVAQLAGVYPFVLEVAASIKTIADLKGKKVGVSSVGSSSDIATRAALKKIGLDPDKDVTIVPVGSAAQRLAARKPASTCSTTSRRRSCRRRTPRWS